MASNFRKLNAAVFGFHPKMHTSVGRGGTVRRGHALNSAQVKAVKRIHDAGMSKKYKDTELAAIDADSVPVLTKVLLPTQGVTDDDRIGDRIRLSSIQVRISASLTANTSFQRYTLVQWMQDDGIAAPVIGDIFEDVTLGAELALFNVNGSSKYRILWDHLVTNNTGAATRKVIKKLIVPHRKKIRFGDSATTGFGHFYLISSGNKGDGTDDYSAYIRVRYFDN